jgi:hypothetical protein
VEELDYKLQHESNLQAFYENKDANMLQQLCRAKLDQHNTTINNNNVKCTNKHACQKDETSKTLWPIILFKASNWKAKKFKWPPHRPTHDIFFSMNEFVGSFIVSWAMK